MHKHCELCGTIPAAMWYFHDEEIDLCRRCGVEIGAICRYSEKKKLGAYETLYPRTPDPSPKTIRK